MKHPVAGWVAGKNSRFASLWLWLGTFAGVTVSLRVGSFTRTINLGKPWEAR